MSVRCQRNSSFGLQPRAYFDDSRVSFAADSTEAAQQAWTQVQLFDNLSGQVTNVDKSFAVIPRLYFAQVVNDATGGSLAIREAAKVLGHQTLQRLRSIGVGPKNAEKYVATKAMKQFLYGCEVGRPGSSATSRVRYAVSKTLWTKTRTQRNPEVLLTLLRKGHLVDPEQAVLFQTIMGLRRIFRRFLVLAAHAEVLWGHVRDLGRRQLWVGPMRNFACLLRDAQLIWSFNTVATRQGRVIHLWTGSSTWLAHRLREELRWSRWQQATRKDFQGTIHGDQGINIFATTALLRGGLSHPAVKQVFCLVLLRRSINWRADTTTCPYCSDNVDETKEHMFWERSAWDYIRKATVGRFGPALWRRHRALVTRSTGITLMPEWIVTEWQRLSTMVQCVPDRLPCGLARLEVLQDDRGILIWTDGSASHATIPGLSRSGIGIFFKDGSRLNCSAALAGEIQTNNRAELLAVTLAAELGVDLADIPLTWEHRDLWLRLHLACRTISVAFVIVPSHLSLQDCAEQGLDPVVVSGNHAADSLAKAGVAKHRHADRNSQVSDFAQLLEDTMRMQFCMLCICLARQQRDSERPAPAEALAFPRLGPTSTKVGGSIRPASSRQRYWSKAPPVDQAAPAAVALDIELAETLARQTRPRAVQVHSLRHPLGEITNTEWTKAPKPWLLLCKSESSKCAGRHDHTTGRQAGAPPFAGMEWDAKVRRVPIYIRRQEKLDAPNVPGPFERCVQETGVGGEDADDTASQPVPAKLSKSLIDWNKRIERVNARNATAAVQGRHWIALPPAPDCSLSGDQYAALIRKAKVQCKWCKRARTETDHPSHNVHAFWFRPSEVKVIRYGLLAP
eukprot:Skav234963  [mRNA]  locus=scaffold943:53567:56965:+ [translate_table: standard]